MSSLEERIERVEKAIAHYAKHAENCANSKMMYEALVQRLTQLQQEWRDERTALDAGAVRTLETGISRILKDFGEPLAVAKEVRENQQKALLVADDVKRAKLARDEKVVFIAKVVGVILVACEIYRTIRP